MPDAVLLKPGRLTTARRVYRRPMSREQILELFERGAGTDFDPGIVPVFLEMLEEGVFDAMRKEARVNVQQAAMPSAFADVPMVALRDDERPPSAPSYRTETTLKISTPTVFPLTTISPRGSTST